MRALVLESAHSAPSPQSVPNPEPRPHDVVIQVIACGLCRTDLHIIDGELQQPKLPLILGHQVIGRVIGAGELATSPAPGDLVGVPWLGSTCGACRYCQNGQENLCDNAEYTGYSRDGGLAEVMVADSRYCFRLPEKLATPNSAPLLCAGLIGYRSLGMCGAGVESIGIYGFGSAAHLVTQVARHQGIEVFAFTRPGDTQSQAFALGLGATWAGDTDQRPEAELDAAIIFAPAGELVPRALETVRKGGTVVCGGIHMTDLPAFPYRLLWGERVLRSVANLTRQDGEEFLQLAARIDLSPSCEILGLDEAASGLERLRRGEPQGSLVVDLTR